MKNEKINTEIQAINAEKNTANEKWETPEINKIDINMTESGIYSPIIDGNWSSS
nr:hypothetical protein [uncultured Draconibacterium sp.]